MAASVANCCFSVLNASVKIQSSSISSPWCFVSASSLTPRASSNIKRKSSRSDSPSPILNPEVHSPPHKLFNQFPLRFFFFLHGWNYSLQKNYPGRVRDESSNPPQKMAFKAFGSPKKEKKESLSDFSRDQQVCFLLLVGHLYFLWSNAISLCRLILPRFTMHPFSTLLSRFRNQIRFLP